MPFPQIYTQEFSTVSSVYTTYKTECRKCRMEFYVTLNENEVVEVKVEPIENDNRWYWW